MSFLGGAGYFSRTGKVSKGKDAASRETEDVEAESTVSPFAKLSTEEVSVLSKDVSNHMKLDELSPFQNLDEFRNSKVVDGKKDSNCICRAP